MIGKQELLEYSRAVGIRPDIIEKDYVIGWLLGGFGNSTITNRNWIFKGGTCLKKCYFETYRFSEDLDFTVLDKSHMDESFIINTILEVLSWVYDESGIELPEDQVSVEIYMNPRGEGAAQGRIGYIGPLQRRGAIPKIKLDFSSDEILVLNPVNQDVFHPYSDKPGHGFNINCYSYEEIFAEKVRALAERSRPRDLYDVIQLFHNKELINDPGLLLSTLEEKCRYKGIVTPTFSTLDNHLHKDELDSEWKNMLEHQIAVLPPLRHYWDEMPLFFNWLYSNEEAIALEKVTVESGSSPWSPYRLSAITPMSSSINKIQFAASNRLCISLRYNDKVRTVEPYSFRTSREGARLFYGFEHESGQIKCYRVDRFQSVDVSKTTYTPRYTVEISSRGSMRMPQVRRRKRF